MIVDSSGEHRELNGLTKSGTDKNIAKYFGTIDDFLLTSMSSQTDSLTFIKEGSTRRKEILAKFLDLILFEKKFLLAKEEASELKALVRALEGRDYGNEIASCAADVCRNEQAMSSQHDDCDSLKKDISSLEEDISAVTAQIDSIPAEIIDAEKTKSLLKEVEEEVVNLQETKDTTAKTIDKDSKTLEKINEFLSTFDVESYRARKEEIIN